MTNRRKAAATKPQRRALSPFVAIAVIVILVAAIAVFYSRSGKLEIQVPPPDSPMYLQTLPSDEMLAEMRKHTKTGRLSEGIERAAKKRAELRKAGKWPPPSTEKPAMPAAGDESGR